MKTPKICPALLAALLLMTTLLSGQTTLESAQVSGTVSDPTHAAVSGAQVVLIDQRSDVRITVVTDSEGAYLFPSLQPGVYVIDVGRKGFKNSVSPELKLSVGQNFHFDVVLELDAISQSVTVLADAENAYRVVITARK